MQPIAVDIETVDGAGQSSFRWWQPGFRIQSLAFSWRDGMDIRSWFSADPHKIRSTIHRMAHTKTSLIVHNLAFEKGVFETLYPDLEFNWYADTMRMAQLHDNGGDWRDQLFIGDVLDEDESPDLGLSLEAVASRVLQRDLHHHKDERDEYLRGLGIRSKFGANIHRLPHDILERYNTADTTITLEIYETLAPILDGVWQKDWIFYHNRTRLMNSAYRRGTLIDIEQLERNVYAVDQEIDAIEAEFATNYTQAIDLWSKKFNTSTQDFNVGSNKQLKELFCDILGMTAKHLTKTGEEKVRKKEMTREEAFIQYPSFQSKHLSDWGEGGMILAKRRKRMLVLSQELSTLHMARMGQGRCHPEVRVAGTRTNRVTGGKDE